VGLACSAADWVAGASALAGAPPDVLAALEAEAAAVAVEGAQLRLAAGATEAAVAAVLAVLEFNFFSPEGEPLRGWDARLSTLWFFGGLDCPHRACFVLARFSGSAHPLLPKEDASAQPGLDFLGEAKRPFQA
jgi:hypothetical protein